MMLAQNRQLHKMRALSRAQSEYTSRGSSSRVTRAQSDAALYQRGGRRPHRLVFRATRSIRELPLSTTCQVAPILQLLFLVALVALLLTIFSYPIPVEKDPLGTLRVSSVRHRISLLRQNRRNVTTAPEPSNTPKKRWKQPFIPPRKLGGLKQLAVKSELRKDIPRSHIERISVGSFTEVKRVGIWKIAILPSEANRFDVPWLLWDRVDTASFAKSGHRILFSTLKTRLSDGMGHGLTVLNAELSTALNLGLSYTHRVGIYGSLSRELPEAVENIFGWGVGEVPRRFIEKEVCSIEYTSQRNPTAVAENRCLLCRAIRNDSVLPMHGIVEIPTSFSYGCVSCHSTQIAVQSFLRQHGRNFTLFQMSPEKCDQSPKSPDFKLSYRFFYWKYWDLHADSNFGSLPSAEKKEQGRRWALSSQKRQPLRLKQDELNIAVHARRGDFLFEKQRKMIPAKAFKNVIQEVMTAVHEVGGVFAEMSVTVTVYSEGRRRDGIGHLHDTKLMDHDFVDTDGQVRDARWFHHLLVPDGNLVGGNRTHSARESSAQFAGGVRVEFRISTDFAEAVHEMGSADVIVGSASDLSQYAVRVISRAGVQLLPEYIGAIDECCLVKFHHRSGEVSRPKRLVEYWRMYAMANERSARRAFAERRGSGGDS